MRVIKDKVAIVTGAGGGLGRAIALALANEGAHVHLVDIDRQAAEATAELVRDRGVRTAVSQCDLAEPAAIDRLAEECLAHWGAIDILVNNAGVAWFGPTQSMKPAEWDRLLAINLHAPIRLTGLLLPTLLSRPEAHVINMASICGWVCYPQYAAYHVSKYAMVGYSEALRVEYCKKGLGVTAVCPTTVHTGLLPKAPTSFKDRQAKFPPAWFCTTPERVAAKTVRAIYRNSAITVVGWSALALYYSKRLAPWLYYLIHTLGRGKHVRRKLNRAQRALPPTATAKIRPDKAA